MKVLATYGHGTENDFVIIFDPQEKITITREITAALCNRDSGIGADGLIRIAKRNGKWFMDYRNADGSIAEMCGNGIRVMARYLVVNGHQKEGIFPIDTRDGLKHLKVPLNGDITVNMGQLTIEDEEVFVKVGSQTWDAYDISIGNPHAVVFVESIADAGDLKQTPQVSPADAYPDGVNVEFVEFSGDRELRMRVFERGVGETKSCGTGTCAVALAASLKRGERLPAKWVIYPPGGRLEVEIDSHSNATLTGPAVLISEHDISNYISSTPLQASNE